jgi:hypothetical protein
VEIHTVTWTGARFVALTSDADDRVIFLDSTDGMTWQRQRAIGRVGDTYSVRAGPGGVAAVGDRSSAAGGQSSWFSSDGLTWEVHRDAFHAASGATSRGGALDIVATDDGWLAVGWHDRRCSDPCNPDRAMVWTSSNGTDWTELPDQEAFHDGPMEFVARLGTGFVAVGQTPESDYATWTSPDGHTWTSVGDGTAFENASVTGLVVRDGVIVVVGFSDADDLSGFVGQAWWSASGEQWAGADFEGAAFAHSVTATPRGFLVTGGVSPGCLGGIYSSTDGRAWRCDAPVAGFNWLEPVAIASSDTVEVAIGEWFNGKTPEDPPPAETRAIWYRAVQ